MCFFLVLLKLFCYSFYRSEICVYFFLVARKKTVFPFIQSILSQIVQNMNFYGIPKKYDTFGSIETTIEKRSSCRISFTKLQRVSDNQFFCRYDYFFFSRDGFAKKCLQREREGFVVLRDDRTREKGNVSFFNLA